MVDLANVMDECAAISSAKGFNLHQHATQVALVATEVAEALQHVMVDAPFETRIFIQNLQKSVMQFELFRKDAPGYEDCSLVVHRMKLLEELADVCIRVFSYVSANGARDEFLAVMLGKMRMNAHRAHRHGKAF